jgi:DNA-directed RNA polymerase specialized sigma24 family protein
MTSRRLSPRTDDELIGIIRAGGSEREVAWSDLLGRYTPKMFAVARSFDIDIATGEDLVQTAWLRFLERSDQLRDTGSVGPYLCMIVRNEARRLVTRRRIVPVADGWETQAADTPPAASQLIADG